MTFERLFEKYHRIVFFDTETTGFNPVEDQITELAMLAVERGEDGEPEIAEGFDYFVRLEHASEIPEKVRQLTGITELQLATEGISEAAMLQQFTDVIFPVCGEDDGELFFDWMRKGVLLVAHNAHFDLSFIAHSMMRHRKETANNYQFSHWFDVWKWTDFLDTLTVFRDRKGFPHKLENAIRAYGLEGKVKNSHRAIDDTEALFEVCKAMDDERDDLIKYVNLFGYNPKFGVEGKQLRKVKYLPQPTNSSLLEKRLYELQEEGGNVNEPGNR